MCHDCIVDSLDRTTAGALVWPEITDAMRACAADISTFYETYTTGGPLHVITDDFNTDLVDEAFGQRWIDRDEWYWKGKTEEQRQEDSGRAWRILRALIDMEDPERNVTIALAHRFLIPESYPPPVTVVHAREETVIVEENTLVAPDIDYVQTLRVERLVHEDDAGHVHGGREEATVIGWRPGGDLPLGPLLIHELLWPGDRIVLSGGWVRSWADHGELDLGVVIGDAPPPEDWVGVTTVEGIETGDHRG